MQAFAHDLRDVRAAAGNPTYRAMASRSGRSKEALADASRGVRLVSWETVDAYLVACGGNPRDWYDRYCQVQRSLEQSEEDSDTNGDEQEPENPPSETEPEIERGRRTKALLAAATVVCLAAAIGSWALWPAHSGSEQGSQVRGAEAQPMSFRNGDCDHWWPPVGTQNSGWSYRACIRQNPANPSQWRAGAEIRNLQPTTAHIEVYVDWEGIPSTGGGSQSLGHQSIQTGPVQPEEVRQVVGPPLEHPGEGKCVWAEIAPLMTPQRTWSDSPRFDADAH